MLMKNCLNQHFLNDIEQIGSFEYKDAIRREEIANAFYKLGVIVDVCGYVIRRNNRRRSTLAPDFPGNLFCKIAGASFDARLSGFRSYIRSRINPHYSHPSCFESPQEGAVVAPDIDDQ